MDPFQPRAVDLSKGIGAPGTPPVMIAPTPQHKTPGVTPPPPPPKSSGGSNKMGAKVMSILVFAMVAATGLTTFVVNNYKTFFSPRAAETCMNYGMRDFSFSNTPDQDPPNGLVYLAGKAYNNCSTPITLYKYRFWCPTSNRSAHNCSLNQQATQTQVVNPGQVVDFRVEQLIGNNGTCGSAQVDAQFTVEYNPNLNDARYQFGIYGGSTSDCAAPLVCNDLTFVNGSNTSTTVNTPNESRLLTYSATGGTEPYVAVWSVTSTGDKGSLSAQTSGADPTKRITWNAPANPTSGQTWTISARVSDSKGLVATGACNKVFTYAQPQISCSGITVSPSSSTITSASETRTLTPTVTGTTNYVVTWTQTGGSTAQSANRQAGVWRAPSTLPTSSTNWTVTATITETVGQGATPRTATCNTQFSYSPAQTYQYKTCENQACVTKDCNPRTTACASSNDCSSDSDCKTVTVTHKICRNEACVSVNGAGSDQCSSDVSCRPSATPAPIPTSGTTTPTVVILGSGIVLTILGGLLLL